jgi:phosphate transport system protein
VQFIENRVNQMEVEIDHELITIIARRQPTARDLRLLMAFSKATANLERMGDEAASMARMVRSIIESGAARALPSSDLRVAAELASGLLRKALDAFARLDTGRAGHPEGGRPDRPRVRRLRAQAHHLHDGRARTISPSLDLLFLAKAIERIGDHSKNIAELIIYLVEGKDVRHQALESIESVVQ